MLNVLVYALPNTTGGGYSVILNLYEDIKSHKDQYADIHWFLITGADGFENTENITVFNESWALKSYAHRFFFNVVKVKEFVKQHDIKAIISINRRVIGSKTPSIISLHNVLPFYRCGHDVFDSKKDMIKQSVINRSILRSLKQAEFIIIPSNWIKNKLVSKIGIAEDRIFISPISVPEIAALMKNEEETEASGFDPEKRHVVQFIYPSSGYPYKNHIIIVEAAKKLKQEGIDNFLIHLTGIVGNSKTIQKVREEIEQYKLPIEFSGLLSKEELAKAYAQEVLLFPSKIETDGFPLLESMACGGYIIAADCDYAREALLHYDNYDLFDPDDAEALKELMRKTITKGTVHTGKRTEAGIVSPRTEVIVPLLRSIAASDAKRKGQMRG